MTEEDAMTMIILSIIYGISVATIFFFATMYYDNDERSTLKVLLFSAILSIFSPITIIIFLLSVSLEYLREKYFIVNDICGIVKVWLGFRGDDSFSKEALIELYRVLSSDRDKHKWRINDAYAKKMFYKYWGINENN